MPVRGPFFVVLSLRHEAIDPVQPGGVDTDVRKHLGIVD